MEKTIKLNFRRRPNGFVIPLLALFGISKQFTGDKPFSKISAKWSRARITQKQLARFNRMCKIDEKQPISATHPFTLIYPLVQYMLARKEAPLSLFQVLNNRIHICQHRTIGVGETLDITCETQTPRIMPKGLELDITSIIKSRGEICWESIITFYYRGHFGKPDKLVKPLELSPIVDGEVIGEWFLSEAVGFRFAGISGDWNGIHYSKRYARMLGFERDFAQPLLVLAKVADYLVDTNSQEPVALDVLLKGQLYYDRNVTVKGVTNDDSIRFDVYSEGNPRPSLSGKVSNHPLSLQ